MDVGDGDGAAITQYSAAENKLTVQSHPFSVENNETPHDESINIPIRVTYTIDGTELGNEEAVLEVIF